MTSRAAIYARISNKDTRAPKVENQIEACRILADDHGYEIDPGHIYADDGKAASGKAIDDTTLANRPDAQRLLIALRAGEFDVLLAVEGERLARTYLDGLEFIRASSMGGVIWHFDGERTALDPSTPNGEETAVSIFASGRREGRIRDARQKRRYDRERAAGMPLWGPRPYGYEPDRITVREEEAAHIRKAVTDVLSGERSMLRIAKDWNKAQIKTDGMRPRKADEDAGRDVRERKGRDGVARPVRGLWTATTVRQLLLRERNAGLLVHDGVTMPESKIEPIITMEEHENLKARVKAGTPVSERAVTLLGGIIRCECGAVMHGTTSYSQRATDRGRVPAGRRYVYQHYKCSRSLYDKSRRHASIVQNIVDDLIVAMLWADLYTGRLDTPGDDVTAALADVSSRLKENSESTAHVGRILLNRQMKSIHRQANGDLAALDVERAELEAERDQLLARAAEGGALAAFLEEWRQSDAGFTGIEDRAAWETRFWSVWDGMPLERKHALIRARYRPVVKVGGRGVERVSLEPPRG
ncbi:recombinase family protein [Microbacterium sp. ZW T2_14]|uniref:recombinase family protein n=1 Tax=Microbacterium sp. ZW T2_14 TaxID=3378079 RepID=UPI0038542AE2